MPGERDAASVRGGEERLEPEIVAAGLAAWIAAWPDSLIEPGPDSVSPRCPQHHDFASRQLPATHRMRSLARGQVRWLDHERRIGCDHQLQMFDGAGRYVDELLGRLQRLREHFSCYPRDSHGFAALPGIPIQHFEAKPIGWHRLDGHHELVPEDVGEDVRLHEAVESNGASGAQAHLQIGIAAVAFGLLLSAHETAEYAHAIGVLCGNQACPGGEKRTDSGVIFWRSIAVPAIFCAGTHGGDIDSIDPHGDGVGELGASAACAQRSNAERCNAMLSDAPPSRHKDGYSVPAGAEQGWGTPRLVLLEKTMTVDIDSFTAELLEYWFGALHDDMPWDRERAPFAVHFMRWFGKDRAIDQEIKERFEPTLISLTASADAWDRLRSAVADDPRRSLAVTVLLDQLPRNMYRDTPRMYQHDALALAHAYHCLAAGHDRRLSLLERMFAYVPLMHVENLTLQTVMEAKFLALVRDAASARPYNLQFLEFAAAYATRHREVIERFGRFPHRNAILGRQSTAVEIAALESEELAF